MSGLCLAAGTIFVSIPVTAFTLAWTHSIEKTRWEEDWRIADGRLHLVAARIQGSGAGMEPPADAVFRDGRWHYRPAALPIRKVRLTHSPYAAGYELCLAGSCRPLAAWLSTPDEPATIEMSACPPPEN